jgi:hypothetical protein
MNPQVQRLVFATVTILGFAALAAALFPDTSNATTAPKIDLKVDADVLPESILKKVDLKGPATTVMRLGVTCALCHSTVDGSVMPGIGKHLDGWPNLNLDVGKIVSRSPVAEVSHLPDLVTAKLPALRAYQDSLTVRTSAISAVPSRQQRKDDR